MPTRQNTASDNWDMGFSDLIEETPTFMPSHSRQFHEVTKADGAHIYMLRQKPSWSVSSEKSGD